VTVTPDLSGTPILSRLALKCEWLFLHIRGIRRLGRPQRHVPLEEPTRYVVALGLGMEPANKVTKT